MSPSPHLNDAYLQSNWRQGVLYHCEEVVPVKAVVMAGGEGTRLRPLTVNRPKPMVPIVNRPCMEHIVELLKQHGITEVIATLQYLPEVIQDYFGDGSDLGVRMGYSVEVLPLGTAGSVRKIAAELDGTFVVISGDALTDMNLTDLVRFHKERGSVATLALTRVENPLEFGVVITDGTGKVVRFLEKPSWSEVFSDTINTGIYVLEPEVFSLMEEDKVYDWSKDIFPRLLRAGRPMYGYVSRDYWADIGSLAACLQANADCLSGKVRVKMPGEEVRRGMWIGRGAVIDPTAQLTGPLIIGEGATVKAGARIGEFSIIGPNSVIDSGAQIKRSVLMNQVYIGRSADVRAALINRGASIGHGAGVAQGAVIGDDCQLGEGVRVKEDVKLWPNKVIEAGASVNTTLVWGSRQGKAVFGGGGVSGLANIEISPELAVRLGAAYGSAFGRGQSVAVSRDTHPASVMMKRALMAGLASSGVRVFNLEHSPLPLTRYAISALGAQGGAFVEVSSFSPGGMTLKFLDSRGIDIDTASERKIENLLAREDTRRVVGEEVGRVSYPSKFQEFYRTGFMDRIDAGAIRRRQFRVVLDYGHGAAANLLPTVLGELGCQDLGLNTAADHSRLSRTPEEVAQALENLGKMVQQIRADMGALFDASAERVYLVDNRGRPLGGQEALLLFASLALQGAPGGTLAVPVTSTSALNRVAGGAGKVLRTQIAARNLMQAATTGAVVFAGDEAGGYIFPGFYPGMDGAFALAKLLELLALDGRPLDSIIESLPAPDVALISIPCPWEAKGKVMRHLIGVTADRQVELIDGIKVTHGDAWAALLPDPVKPLFHIYAEPGSGAGRGLLDEYRAHVVEAIEGAATGSYGAGEEGEGQ